MRRRSLHAGLLLAVPMALAACSGDSRVNAYRMNPSPAEDTLSQRRVDIDNRLAVTTDTNLRQLNEDVGKVLLLERPSRLTANRVPY